MEQKTKLQIGLEAYYEGDMYDEETGNLRHESVYELGLTLEEYQLCIDWYYLYSDLHRNDSVRYGCDCGCGGDSLDFEYEAEQDEYIEKCMKEIEEQLGEAPIDDTW